MTEHILSLSYGKDSLACLGAIEQLGWPLDRIVHAEVWATDTIPADLPPMVEFKEKADRIIKSRWGIEVEHMRHKLTFEQMLRRPICRGPKEGVIKGWPLTSKSRGWCKTLKIMDRLSPNGAVSYVGIAVDEPARFHNLSDTKSPLWWDWAGQRPTAATGARKTTCCPPSTPRRRVAAVGSATTRAWGNSGSCARTTRSCGH